MGWEITKIAEEAMDILTSGHWGSGAPRGVVRLKIKENQLTGHTASNVIK